MSLKEMTIETVRRLPEESTLEDIMYEINFVAQVMKGINDADKGRVMTTEELLHKVETWQQ